MFKLLLAVITALLLVGLGTVTVPAGAHHCGCQEDNSGHGSSSSGSSGSDNSGSGSSGSDDDGSNSGTGNGDGCVSNSGSGNAGGDNSGPGNAEDDCPVDQPDDPGDGNDPGDSNNPTGSSNPTGSVGQSAGAGTVVAGVQASTGATQAVPTAVAAGVTGEQDSGSTLGGLMILLGVATMFLALVHRRSRA